MKDSKNWGFNIKTNERGAQTVEVRNDQGDVVAEIIAVPVSANGMSIDVKPMVHAKVQDIVFGVDEVERRDDRFIYRTKNHNGKINDLCLPFVCVEINPS